MKITIIDGQGGKIGKTIVEQLKKRHPEQELYAIGTNSLATATMLKAGADYGATGENPCIVNAQDSDVIIGPVGIVVANALLGEITPAIATAVGASKAYKILIPMNRCNHYVVGCDENGLSDNIRMVCEKVDSLL
jgi:prephenate dehydrogenase